MPYSSQIVSYIDSVIGEALTDSRFTPRLMAGLVQTIPIQSPAEDGKVIFIPAIVSGINDAVAVVPDDNFNLITYHRLITNTYSAKEGSKNFGDGLSYQQAISDVIMIVIAFNGKVRLTAEQLEALIVQSMPNLFAKDFTTDLQMNSIYAQVMSSSFDSVALFSQEYRGETYYIKPDMSLFQIRYQIQASYKKGCFKICDDC